MATLGKTTHLPPIYNWSEHERAFKELSDSQPDTGVVGCLIQFPVADGFAVYLVTSESPLTLSHVDWCDGYRIPDAHIRGLELADVMDQVGRQRLMAQFFSNKG